MFSQQFPSIFIFCEFILKGMNKTTIQIDNSVYAIDNKYIISMEDNGIIMQGDKFLEYSQFSQDFFNSTKFTNPFLGENEKGS